MNKTPAPFDIAIIGGGMIGHSLIAALREPIRRGLRLLIIDPAPPPSGGRSTSPAFDDRATALSLGSTHLLAHWGLWPRLQEAATPVRNIEVTEQGALSSLRLSEQESGSDPLGFILANPWLGQCLLENTGNLPVTQLFDTQVTQIKVEADSAVLKLDKHPDLQARLVVIADGGRSDLADQLGFAADKKDFHQHAVVASVETEQPHLHCAFERFTPMGPMALLPMSTAESNRTSALVWSVDPALAQHLTSASDAEFLSLAHQAFGNRLGAWLRTTDRVQYPLIRSYRVEQVRHRLVLLGNSALSLHPVAGQGFNLALRAVAALSEQISHQDDPGALDGLMAYQNRVHADQWSVMTFCEQLVEVYEKPLLTMPRRLLLGTLDHHRISKGWFARFSMGILPHQQYARNREWT